VGLEQHRASAGGEVSELKAEITVEMAMRERELP